MIEADHVTLLLRIEVKYVSVTALLLLFFFLFSCGNYHLRSFFPKRRFILRQISAQFPGFPSMLEIERNQSLTLMNSHFSLDTPLPLLPGQVEIGGMHCRPGKPLPQVGCLLR